MTTPWQRGKAGASPVGDVVAALAADTSLTSVGKVARAGVREAVSRGARLRFLQVMREGLSAEERAARDEATFTAALRALREAPRLPVTFEVLDGDAGETFVRRSRGASVLVVAHDGDAGTAGYCQRHAECDVLTVHSDEGAPAAS